MQVLRRYNKDNKILDQIVIIIIISYKICFKIFKKWIENINQYKIIKILENNINNLFKKKNQ